MKRRVKAKRMKTKRAARDALRRKIAAALRRKEAASARREEKKEATRAAPPAQRLDWAFEDWKRRIQENDKNLNAYIFAIDNFIDTIQVFLDKIRDTRENNKGLRQNMADRAQQLRHVADSYRLTP